MDLSNAIFQGWGDVLRTIVVGTLGYIAIVFILRVSGNRTLATLNAFDFIVSVAMGSIFASILLSESVSLTEGITAVILLAVLQSIVSALSVRSDTFASLVRSEPVVLMKDGRHLPAAMRKARVARRELEAVVRASGIHMQDVSAVFLESDGTFSVMDRRAEVRGIPPQKEDPVS